MASSSYAEALRRVGLRPAGGNHGTIKKYVAQWDISVEHFGARGPYPRGGRAATPLEDVLVSRSHYHRGALKRRLYEAGLKSPACELCGQGDQWRGRAMALILDHVNGDATDNRLVNLRIVCPNCNSTLETHCGRNKPRGRPPRECAECRGSFRPQREEQRFCSRACSGADIGRRAQRAERPPLEELLSAIASEGYEAVGRQFGVSGNAVRKWIRSQGVAPPAGGGRDANPPPLPSAAMTDNDARKALALLADGTSMYAVAKLLGVSRNTIRGLARGITYRHIARPPAGFADAA